MSQVNNFNDKIDNDVIDSILNKGFTKEGEPDVAKWMLRQLFRKAAEYAGKGKKSGKDGKESYEYATCDEINEYIFEVEKILSGSKKILRRLLVADGRVKSKLYAKEKVERENAEDDKIIEEAKLRKEQRNHSLAQALQSQEWGKSSETQEKLSTFITAEYLDILADTNGLHPKHKEQLANMKEILANNPNCMLDADRLTVSEDGVLLIDGKTVPSDLVDHSDKSGYENRKKGFQKYTDMAVEGSKFLYAEEVLRLLDFMGDLSGDKFDPGILNSTNLRDKSLLKEEILTQLSSGSNLSALSNLSKVVNLEGYFPMGIDRHWHIIYAYVQPGSFRFASGFDRRGNLSCLASS